MKFKVGDIVYSGGGNGEFCSFFKAKVSQVFNGDYRLFPIEDYGSIWGEGFPECDVVEDSIESTTFATFEEAKKMVFRDMHVIDREFIKLYFERRA
jgi:hypothetical protein